MGSLIDVLLGILGILFIVLILLLIDGITAKYFCNKIKYRIIEIKETSITKYIIQRRFLWFFWINAYDNSIYVSSLDLAKFAIKELKFKVKKEVVYEE